MFYIAYWKGPQGPHITAAFETEAEARKALPGYSDYSRGNIWRVISEEEFRQFETGERAAIFRPGEWVRWCSQDREKRGQVIAIVPAGEDPVGPILRVVREPYFLMFHGREPHSRDHVSYAVGVKRSKRANLRVYWPRVSKLVSDG